MLRQQLHARPTLQLADHAGNALSGLEPDQNVHMVGARGEVDHGVSTLLADPLDQGLDRCRMALAKHRLPAASAPRDEVVQTASVHRLPTAEKGLLEMRSHGAVHRTSSCGDD